MRHFFQFEMQRGIFLDLQKKMTVQTEGIRGGVDWVKKRNENKGREG